MIEELISEKSETVTVLNNKGEQTEREVVSDEEYYAVENYIRTLTIKCLLNDPMCRRSLTAIKTKMPSEKDALSQLAALIPNCDLIVLYKRALKICDGLSPAEKELALVEYNNYMEGKIKTAGEHLNINKSQKASADNIMHSDSGGKYKRRSII